MRYRGMARKPTFEFSPEEPEAAARYWRDKATKLDQQVAEPKAALARKKAFEAGEPVSAIVRARKPEPRW